MADNDPLLQNELARAFGLLQPPSTDKTHYEALGRFIAAFATAEAIIHILTRKLSGLSDEKARAVFAGARLPDVTDKLRHFMRLDKLETPICSEIECCLTQLGHISDRRHKLIHRGATYFAGTFIVSNVQIAKSTENIEVETISEQTLADMAADCGSIYLRLDAVVAQPSKAEAPLVKHLKEQPWRYTPPPPKIQNQQPRKAHK